MSKVTNSQEMLDLIGELVAVVKTAGSDPGRVYDIFGAVIDYTDRCARKRVVDGSRYTFEQAWDEAHEPRSSSCAW
jgi:hypothetical protein